MMTSKASERVVLTFQSYVTLLNVTVDELGTPNGVQPTARVKIDASALDQVVLDWHTDVEIHSVGVDGATLLFRGTVARVQMPAADELELELRTGPDLLEDSAMSATLIRDATKADIMWSTFAAGGWDTEKLNIEGTEVLIDEEFEVLVPLAGLQIETPVAIDHVRLSPRPYESPMDVTDDFDDLARQFRECSGVAAVNVVASTLFDAEQRGTAAIDQAIATALLLHRAASTDRVKLAHGYSREQAGGVLRRQTAVVVRGRWGRRWIRNTDVVRPLPEPQRELRLGATDVDPPHLQNVPSTDRQALASWWRGIREVDRVAGLMALWEAIEFYSSGTSVKGTFSKTEVRELRRRAIEGLATDQVRRFDELVGRLNEAPLMVRLEAAATRDGVLLTAGDLGILKSLRALRNDIVHGRTSRIPELSDLRRGLGIVTRLLLARLNHVPAPAAQDEAAPATDLDLAQRAAEVAMLMIPYAASGETIPDPVVARVTRVWGEANETELARGAICACRVALTHLAKRFLAGSVTDAAATATERLERLKSDDKGGFGPLAYDDAGEALGMMATGIRDGGEMDFPAHLSSGTDLVSSFTVAITALLFELADHYDIAPARAAAGLGQELARIATRSG